MEQKKKKREEEEENSVATLYPFLTNYSAQILHIMAATLFHARPVLAAASSSGFRESGLQSLRCLESDDAPSPIVAIRSSGLSLESIIGYCDGDNNVDTASEPVIHSLVTEEYLEMLVAMSNERFTVNDNRKERLFTALRDMCSPGRGRLPKHPDWEDPEERRRRKVAEGLLRKRHLLENRESTGSSGIDVEEGPGAIDGLP